MGCKHYREWQEWVEGEDPYSGEITSEFLTRTHSLDEDIDVHRFRCRQCGCIGYYSRTAALSTGRASSPQGSKVCNRSYWISSRPIAGPCNQSIPSIVPRHVLAPHRQAYSSRVASSVGSSTCRP